ncbi:hypothetical protein Tco_0857382 [Tanacetum coccineum]|uniref:Uncharacterized protein n=1 Tax=Tanacetum coccineum TaxID=301880 RepID=A0ABQ5B680_9ASTR
MTSESTSSKQSQQIIPSSKVNFRCTYSIIGFNNAVALLEHSNELFQPMLTKVEEKTKTITFLLSWWDEPLSFTHDEFISAIGLPICKDAVPLPPNETARAGLATLGLFDKEKSILSSTVLLAEIKRLADLRVQEEESEKALKKLLYPATVKAHILKWKEHEEKKAKLVNEYYECIQGRTDPLPITKISYIINSQKEPTMRITRAKNLGLPPPPALATFGMTAEDKKRKRNETLKEVFVKERIDVDGT